ncbi:MAG: eCIS core domain-containing protein [Chloroflexota bacterium]
MTGGRTIIRQVHIGEPRDRRVNALAESVNGNLCVGCDQAHAVDVRALVNPRVAHNLDSGRRATAVLALQRTHGNAYVNRMLGVGKARRAAGAGLVDGVCKPPRSLPLIRRQPVAGVPVCQSVPGLPDALVGNLDLLVGGTDPAGRQQAVDSLVNYLIMQGQIDPFLIENGRVRYDPSLSDEGHTQQWYEKMPNGDTKALPSTVRVGPPAFSSVAWLYTVILHEYEHARQFAILQSVPGGQANREVDAYLSSIEMAQMSGLGPEEVSELWQRLNEWWPELDDTTKEVYQARYNAAENYVVGLVGHEQGAASVMRRQAVGPRPLVADFTVTAIEAERGAGGVLPDSLRRRAEHALGADFSGVRIHTDDRSDTLCQALQAQAFTTGSDIFFGKSEFRPDTESGSRLLAHELTHVVQQASGSLTSAEPVVSDPSDSFERDANRVAEEVSISADRETEEPLTAIGQPTVAGISAPSGAVVARQAAPEAPTSAIPAASTSAIPATPPTPLGEAPSTEAAAAVAEERYNLTIGNDVLENVTRAQAIRVLRRHYQRIEGWTEAEAGSHKRLKDICAEQWIVASIADNLGGVVMPGLEIWNLPRSLLTAAKSDLDAGDVKKSVDSISKAEEAYVACHRIFYHYKEGHISGAETAVTALKVTAIAGAVAATVATGGIAAGGAAPTLGIAAGTAKLGLAGVSTTVGVTAGAYGMTQEAATQTGEQLVGTRESFDLLAILRRGAVDAVTGFVGALTGGALSGLLKSTFGSYLRNVGDNVLLEMGLTRDAFLTNSQRFLADFLGGVGVAPLTTAVAAVVNRLLGGEKLPDTPGEFVDRVVQEMVRGGAIQLFLGGFMHAYGVRPPQAVSAAAPRGPTTPSGAVPLEYAPTLEAPTVGATRPGAGPGPTTTLPAPPFELAPTIKMPAMEGAQPPSPPRLPTTEPPLSSRLPTTEPPFPAEQTGPPAPGRARTPIPGEPLSLAQRIDDVAQAQRLRDQFVLEGRPVRQLMRPEAVREEWNRVLGQRGDPPPAFIDSRGQLMCDFGRLGPVPEQVLLGRATQRPRPAGAAQAGEGRVVQPINDVTQARQLRDQYGLEGRQYIESYKSAYYAEDYHLGGGIGDPPPAYINDRGVLVYDANRVGPMPESLLGRRPR